MIPRRPCPIAQQGSTLIETMVALLILSVGLLGLMKLQIESMRQAADSRFVVIAGAKAQTLMDAISYERKLEGIAVTPYNDAEWHLEKNTHPGSVSNEILKSWLTSIQGALPAGTASIDCASHVCTIEIFWSPGKTKQFNKSIVNEQSAKYVVQNPNEDI